MISFSIWGRAADLLAAPLPRTVKELHCADLSAAFLNFSRRELAEFPDDRGRDAGYPTPLAQIRTNPIKFPFAARTRIYETGVPYGAVGSEVGIDFGAIEPVIKFDRRPFEHPLYLLLSRRASSLWLGTCREHGG
jgi:hypothetical protein